MGEPEGSGFELCSSKHGPSLAASTTWDLVRMQTHKTHGVRMCVLKIEKPASAIIWTSGSQLLTGLESPPVLEQIPVLGQTSSVRIPR